MSDWCLTHASRRRVKINYLDHADDTWVVYALGQLPIDITWCHYRSPGVDNTYLMCRQMSPVTIWLTGYLARIVILASTHDKAQHVHATLQLLRETDMHALQQCMISSGVAGAK